MKDMELIEATTVIGFGFLVVVFTIGELIVTWRSELKSNRCERRL